MEKSFQEWLNVKKLEYDGKHIDLSHIKNMVNVKEQLKLVILKSLEISNSKKIRRGILS
jgi:hypothetical protein